MTKLATFSVGEIVKAFGSKRSDRAEGVVKFLTCAAATGTGGKTCDRNICNHAPKDRIWVKWPDGSLCSYKMHELENDLDGEDEVLKSMEDLLDSEHKEDVENAAMIVKTILQTRRNRATQKKENPMSSSVEQKSLMGMIKVDAGNAAYRVAAKQINTGLRNAIVEMLKSKGATNDHVAAAAMFLETEWGAAILGTIAGHGLGYVPGIKEDPRVKRLAEEFRISSMATVGNEVFGLAISSLLPVVTNALNSLPVENNEVQTMEGHKSTSEEVEIEVETDLSDLENHLEQEEKKVATIGKG